MTAADPADAEAGVDPEEYIRAVAAAMQAADHAAAVAARTREEAAAGLRSSRVQISQETPASAAEDAADASLSLLSAYSKVAARLPTLGAPRSPLPIPARRAGVIPAEEDAQASAGPGSVGLPSASGNASYMSGPLVSGAASSIYPTHAQAASMTGTGLGNVSLLSMTADTNASFTARAVDFLRQPRTVPLADTTAASSLSGGSGGGASGRGLAIGRAITTGVQSGVGNASANVSGNVSVASLSRSLGGRIAAIAGEAGDAGEAGSFHYHAFQDQASDQRRGSVGSVSSGSTLSRGLL